MYAHSSRSHFSWPESAHEARHRRQTRNKHNKTRWGLLAFLCYIGADFSRLRSGVLEHAKSAQICLSWSRVLFLMPNGMTDERLSLTFLAKWRARGSACYAPRSGGTRSLCADNSGRLAVFCSARYWQRPILYCPLVVAPRARGQLIFTAGWWRIARRADGQKSGSPF